MAAELIIAPEAEQDIDEAYAWYERQRVGLGERFLTSVDACIQAICRTPEMHQTIHENYRPSPKMIQRRPKWLVSDREQM
jgi:plasmid stabilization system protein ParE